MSSGKGEDYKCRNIPLVGGREGQKIAVSSGRGKNYMYEFVLVGRGE